MCGSKKIVLGGVQFGLDYGITNSKGKPSDQGVADLLDYAAINNTLVIDTAAAYGDSERVIGDALASLDLKARVITKLDPLLDAHRFSPTELCKEVDESVENSLERLRVKSIDTLLLHRADQLTAYNSIIWRRLIEHCESGVVKRLGVSVQSPAEFLLALDYPEVAVIQFPYNLLDHRWATAIAAASDVKQARYLELHVRSVLLQGLLTSDAADLWQKANVDEPSIVNDWLERCVESFGRLDRVDLSIAFAKSLELIDGVVIGVNDLDQLKVNLGYFRRPNLTESQLTEIEKTRPIFPNRTLNPTLWK